NRRREECDRAAAFFGVPTLRDVTAEQVTLCPPGLDDVAFRRARHIVTENARVLRTCTALELGDIATVGELMAGSHRSMRDDFQITHPKVDELVDILSDTLGTRGGARMTGGGFGGCVVALVPADLLDAAKAAIAERYRDPQNEPATVYVCEASAGVSLLPESS
ncbi:MAG: galactokinase, partial [Gluconacetobacter diazotrophicus]|nr:galactokinase [Gluconacetobacter diazotrophicus]